MNGVIDAYRNEKEMQPKKNRANNCMTQHLRFDGFMNSARLFFSDRESAIKLEATCKNKRYYHEKLLFISLWRHSKGAADVL
jgi:hypothetical protein